MLNISSMFLIFLEISSIIFACAWLVAMPGGPAASAAPAAAVICSNCLTRSRTLEISVMTCRKPLASSLPSCGRAPSSSSRYWAIFCMRSADAAELTCRLTRFASKEASLALA